MTIYSLWSSLSTENVCKEILLASDAVEDTFINNYHVTSEEKRHYLFFEALEVRMSQPLC